MATEEDFDKLFDGSILESLEGALNDISLQMQSSSSDLKNTTEGDVLSLNSDYSSIHDDDAYTYDTNDTGFLSDEEEDPETGEQELFAMMDNLVAELETEMEFFVDQSNGWEERSTVMKQEENVEKDSTPDAQTSSDEIAGVDRTKSVGVPQDQNMNQRAKSLLKVLSGLAQPDDTRQLDEDTGTGSQNASAKGDFVDCGNKQTNSRSNSEEASDASFPSENIMKPETEDSCKAHYVPTEADFKHFVGVLADYSKRRRRARAHDRSNLVAMEGERSLDPTFENPASQTDTPETTCSNSQVPLKPSKESGFPVCELPRSKEDELNAVQEEREKTSRAIANFTLKKRREYMQRKSRNRNIGAVAPIDSSSAVTAVKSISGDSNCGRKEAINDNSSESVRRTSPSKKKKKKRRRTNKHRKGRPKRLPGGLQDPQPTDGSLGARQYHASNNRYDNRTREEVIRALAKTELWRWLVTQVNEGK